MKTTYLRRMERKKMTFRLIVEISPSNRTECSSMHCGRKILKGTIRLKEQDGEFNGSPRWRYFCPECGVEHLDNRITIIRQTQDKLCRLNRITQQNNHSENHVNNGGIHKD